MKVLMLDIGETNVKLMASGHEGRRKVPSGPHLTPSQMMDGILAQTEDWTYDAVSIGFPSLVMEGKPAREPLNLGPGWLKFDYEKAFGKPVRFINDAAMQALASYETGRMLFLGFGTSPGAAVVVDDVIVTLEIGMMRLSRKQNFLNTLSDEARRRKGRKRWARYAAEAVEILRDIFKPDDIVIGGGNAKDLTPLPEGCRIRDNQRAFVGAARLWPGTDMLAEPFGSSWRIKRKKGKQ